MSRKPWLPGSAGMVLEWEGMPDKSVVGDLNRRDPS